MLGASTRRSCDTKKQGDLRQKSKNADAGRNRCNRTKTRASHFFFCGRATNSLNTLIATPRLLMRGTMPIFITKCILSFALVVIILGSLFVDAAAFLSGVQSGKTIGKCSIRKPSMELRMTVLNYKGKKADVREGSPLSRACAQLGVKPNYNCKK